MLCFERNWMTGKMGFPDLKRGSNILDYLVEEAKAEAARAGGRYLAARLS